MAKISLATVAAATLLWVGVALFGPAEVSVAGVLEPVAAASGEARAVHVVMRVLSREGEDFEFVDVGAPPMIFEAWIERTSDAAVPGRALLSKGDRIYACDGDEMITYHPPRNEALRSPGCSLDLEMFWPQAWVRGLLGVDPGRVRIVEHEKGISSGRILLREPGVESAGRAAAFLKEFDRETEITWDLATHRLISLRRWVLQDGRHMVSETLSVEYLPRADREMFTVNLPETVRWVSLREATAELAALGPREVTRQFLQAAARADRETLELLGATPYQAERIAQAGVTEVLSVGQPFAAGAYPGLYVPYVIRIGSAEGGRKEFRLAVRNDNDQKRWVYDGGF